MNFALPAELTFSMVRFFSNAVQNGNGGAILLGRGGHSVFQSSRFFRNHALNGFGGAFLCLSKCNCVFSNSSFLNNIAHSGAGIYSSNGHLSITGETKFRNNLAEYYGGALFCLNCTIKLAVVHVQNNVAFAGGGLFLKRSSGTIYSVIFSNNTAKNNGGGIFIVIQSIQESVTVTSLKTMLT